MVQGWSLRRKRETCLKTTFMIRKMIQMRDPIGYRNFVEIK